jgi:hypothetical protein
VPAQVFSLTIFVGYNCPISISYSDDLNVQHNVVFMPLVAPISSLVQMEGITYPYNYDLETYLLYTTLNDGVIDTYKWQYNPGKDLFFPKVLPDL